MNEGDDLYIGPYRVIRKIGDGAAAEVFLVWDGTLDVLRALKLARARADMTRHMDLHDEARRLAKLSGSPHVVTVYGVDEHEGRIFILMEYMDGGDLRQDIGCGSTEVVREYLIHAAYGLADAHAIGMVHRDVKPANLLKTRQGTVKVSDFGIARRMGDPHATTAGHVIGTRRYMAPEQLSGREAESPTDVYALGVVAHELLTGTVPFAADERRRIREDVPPLSTLVVGLSPPFAETIDAMLRRRPGDRPTASAARRALEGIAPPPPAQRPWYRTAGAVTAPVVGLAMAGVAIRTGTREMLAAAALATGSLVGAAYLDDRRRRG